MRAHATLTAEADGRGGTRIGVLRSDWPLMLRGTLPRPTDPAARWAARDAVPARVHLAAGGAAPVGGDRLRLDVSVGPGSALVLEEVSPTLLLPGPHGDESGLDVHVHVGPGGTLVWLPGPVIAARGCRHRTDVRISLDADARLLLREETLFGRHGEHPGELRQRLRVEVDGRPVHDQELAVGAPGWDGPAVTAGHRAVGSLLVVEPGHAPVPADAYGPDAAAMPLPGPGTLVSALAPDTSTLRKRLDAALTDLTAQPERLVS